MKRESIFYFLVFFPFMLFAQVTQWRGPNRDGHFQEKGLEKIWPENGPKLLFKTEKIGKGWSSPVISKDKIFITGLIDTVDFLTCIDMTGKILWQKPYGRAWNQTFPDTRSTPSILNGKIYLATGMGKVVCIDEQTEQELWSNNALQNYKGSTGEWGVAESILLVDGKAIFTTGGNKTTMVALDTETGKEVWITKSLNDNTAYVSPILIEQNGKKQIVGVSAKYIFGVDPNNGDIVWTFNYLDLDPSEWDNTGGVINCTSPIYHDGFLYVTSGYNHTGAKFKVKDDLSGVEFLWKDELLDNHHGGVVLVDGYIYGSNWVSNGKGNWCCISFESGEKKYETTFKNKGSIVAADGMLYIYSEQPGFVGLVKPNPEKFELVSSFQVIEGTGPHWAHPTINDGKLYIRHDNVLMVYDIK